MNETPIIFFIPTLNCTISYKGVKQVVASTQDQEKLSLAIVLSIADNYLKIKPYFIFYENKDSQILYIRINEIPFSKKKDILSKIIMG